MARVNYIREVEGFGNYAEANRLGGSERLLWSALFRVFNGRAFGGEWPDGYVEIRNSELICETGLSRTTIWRARQKLAERGIIDYVLGDGETLTGYKLRYFSVEGLVDNFEKGDLLVDKSPNPVQIEQGGVQNEQGGVQNEQGGVQNEQGYNSSTNVRDINNNQTEEEYIYNNIIGRARDEIERTIGESYRQKVGRAPTPAEVEAIREVAEYTGCPVELVREAIARGAAANYPSKYAIKCLIQWDDDGIRTAEEVEVCERYRELSRTPRPDIREKAQSKLAAYLQEIQLKHRMVTA